MKKSKWVGLLAAGRMTESSLAKLPALVRAIGPIVAANRRLASRYANVLRAGWAADPAELLNCRLVVVQAKQDEWCALSVRLPRTRCPVALLDDDQDATMQCQLRMAGVAACTMGISPLAKRPVVLVDGDPAAVRAVRVWAAGGGVRCVELKSGGRMSYRAGIVMVSALVTPLVDAATRSLRASGLGQVDSRRIVAHVLGGALRSYDAHGRKGWPNPAAEGRRAAIAAQCKALNGGEYGLGPLYSHVLTACLEYYGQESEWLIESAGTAKASK